jgi:tetratricopeptide (TPR) repeat protein
MEALRLRRDLRWGEPGVVLGDALLAAGRPAEALSAYLQATTVHGSFAEAWCKAGVAARAAGRPEEAVRCWNLTLSTTVGAPAYKRRRDRLWRWRAWWALRRG